MAVDPSEEALSEEVSEASAAAPSVAAVQEAAGSPPKKGVIQDVEGVTQDVEQK